MFTASYAVTKNQIREIGKINLQTDPINNVTIYYPTEFILSNKKEIAKVHSVDLIELIEEKITKISIDKSRNSVILITDYNGEVTIVSFSEILPEISIIPPMIVFDKVKGSIGDTVRVQDNGLGNLDLGAIDAELSSATQKKIYLQMDNMPKAVIKKYFESVSIVFPTDKSTMRWINDVVEIKIIEII